MSNLSSQELADFAALVAAALKSQGATTKSPGVKDLGIALPTPFAGGKDYLRFRRECLAYIAADETNSIFVDDKKKVAFVLSYMKEGSASTWAQNYYDGITDSNGAIKITDTFKDFLDKLDLSFKDPGEKERAYTRWIAMHQGNTDASVFLANFEIAMSQAGISTSDTNVVLPQLKAALNLDVAMGIVRLPDSAIKTYDDMKSYAIKIDAQEREVRQMRRQNAPPTQPPR